MGKGVVAFVVGLTALSVAPAYAEEIEKQSGGNASESGKNEIPICKKMIPIDVGIGPELNGKTSVGDAAGAEVQDMARVEMLHKYEVAKRLEYAVTCELERLGYIAAKPIKINGLIADFNLRSTETIVASSVVPLVAAVNAGNVDKLVVNIDVVVQGDNQPYKFTVRDSTRKGNVFSKTVPTQRLEYMVTAVTKDVIKKVLREGFIAEPYVISSGDQSQSMSDAIATGNREVLLRITKTLSKQKDPIDIAILDKVADRIYLSQMDADGGMADTLSHMCKLLGGSKNGKYKQLLREVSEKAAHKTLRKYAAQSAEQLPDGALAYSPQLAIKQ